MTFIAMVDNATSGSGTPSGTVTFLSSTHPDRPGHGPRGHHHGIATFSTSTLPVGILHDHRLLQRRCDLCRHSDAAPEEIDAVGTTASTTTLTAAPNPAPLNQSVTFTATVEPRRARARRPGR